MAPVSYPQAANRLYALPPWPERVLWLLCCVPLVHIGVLVVRSDLSLGTATLLHMLRPLGTLGACGMIVYAASLVSGRRRWGWFCLAVAVLCAAIFSFAKAVFGASIGMPPMRALWAVMYLAAFSGIALHLQRHEWWVGSRWRVVASGVTVGLSTLILIQLLLPSALPTWRWTARTSTVVPSLSFDVGLLFAFGMIAGRARRVHSPVIPYVIFSLLCVLLAETLLLIIYWSPWSLTLQFVVMPLYTLHTVLLAFAAYRDATQRQTPPPVRSDIIPLGEWIVWTFVPLGWLLAAFAAATLGGRASPLQLILLLTAALAHEGLAVWDYTRVWRSLYQANRHLAAYAAQAEAHAMLEERTRVAHEIHDGLGHYFTAIDMQLAAGKALLASQPERALTSFDHAQQLTVEGLAEVRRSVSALRESPLNQRSIDQALELLVATSNAAGNRTTLQIAGQPRPLAQQVEEAVYRVVQEGLTNARKHAPQSTVKVQLDYADPTQVRVVVVDTGLGTAQPQGGFGLIGLRERVGLLGGTMQIQSRPGHGFRIVVELPG